MPSEVIEKLKEEKTEFIKQIGGEDNLFDSIESAFPNYFLIKEVDIFSVNDSSIRYLKEFKQLLLLSLAEGLPHRAFVL